ncbi:MAG: hypothetical protein WCC94_03960 [Candidatus Bathyarchaeia archaeon]
MTDAGLSWETLRPEDRVRLSIEMTNVVVQICADGIRETHPEITEEQLISLLRRRFSFGRRPSPEE